MVLNRSILLTGALAAVVILGGCAKKEGAANQAASSTEGGSQAAPAAQEQAKGAAPAAKGQSGGSTAVSVPAPPPPRTFTVAAGTPVAIRTLTAITTKTAKAGDVFKGTLAEAITVDGYVVAKKGAAVTGEIAQSDPGGRVKGVASVSVVLTSIETIDAGPVNVQTGQFTQDAKSSKKKDAVKVGVATGVGAAIGAIAGGGRGAAIGAGAGAAGGTGLVMATRGDPAQIPAESPLKFELSAPFSVSEKK